MVYASNGDDKGITDDAVDSRFYFQANKNTSSVKAESAVLPHKTTNTSASDDFERFLVAQSATCFDAVFAKLATQQQPVDATSLVS